MPLELELVLLEALEVEPLEVGVLLVAIVKGLLVVEILRALVVIRCFLISIGVLKSLRTLLLAFYLL